MLKLDLHIHSKYSRADGHGAPAQKVRWAKKRGLDGIAITDHNVMEGVARASEFLETNRRAYGEFILIPGCEVRSSAGDILAYGLAEPVEAGQSVAATIDAIHDAGGIAVYAHPYRAWAGIDPAKAKGQRFDAIETTNAGSLERKNRKARALATQWGANRTGGSDSHYTVGIGRAGTAVLVEGITGADAGVVDTVLDAIARGRTAPFGCGLTLPGGFLKGTWTVLRWLAHFGGRI